MTVFWNNGSNVITTSRDETLQVINQHKEVHYFEVICIFGRSINMTDDLSE